MGLYFGDYCQICFLVQYGLREILTLNCYISTPLKKNKNKSENKILPDILKYGYFIVC